MAARPNYVKDMIILRINGQKKTIPRADELTVAQYVRLTAKPEFNLIDYLAAVDNLDAQNVSKYIIQNPQFLSNQLFAKFPDYSKTKAKRFIVIKGVFYKLDSDFTLGQRFIIEENGKNKKGFELMLFILAVCADVDNYESLLIEIDGMKAANVLPEAFFLLKILQTGKRSGLTNLKRLFLLKKTKS